ncbi:esterase/lipase family protein [Bacillus cereus]
MDKYRLLLRLVIIFLFFGITCSLSSVSAKTNPEYGKIFPPKETFTPGDWFTGATPLHVDPKKAPIVFVHGLNGSANNWYGDTFYYGQNDMYDSFYHAGYQTAFVQLYDAAGKGSVSPWTNGQLLAEKLETIYQYFGKKVNVVAHSKGGIDTQAALVQYGAHRFVDKVITLGSPHYGTHIADLSYSWWAGWITSLLGQKNGGTYALQTGEMSRFRSIIDTSPAVNFNSYYTIAGTSWGPALSALSVGGLYLSPYGKNDGLVNEWSTTLPYSTHLFSDSQLDHDSIRTGSAVFSRIEPYLQNTHKKNALISSSLSHPNDQMGLTENQTILGGELLPHNQNHATFTVDTETQATVSVLTATNNVDIQLISPAGNRYTKKDAILTMGDDSFFKGASIQTFQIKNMEIGEWTIDMKTVASKDAYLVIVHYEEEAPFKLKVPNNIKGQEAKLQLHPSDHVPIETDDFDITVRIIDSTGTLISQSNQLQQLNDQTLSTTLQNIKQSGVYNITVDVQGNNKKGNPYTRTIVRSMYIEK